MREREDFYSKLKYPQPYSIHIHTGNLALDDKIRESEHARAKYLSKYYHSKRSKRNY
jgi:hypothetical protein